jgi:catechol 2,3-dioxygenase-like lactoylglutathione lyase family enzyme
MFNRLHHIAIICSDYPRSKHFYVEILGFKILREVYREDRRSFKLGLLVGDRYQLELFSFSKSTSPAIVSRGARLAPYCVRSRRCARHYPNTKG